MLERARLGMSMFLLSQAVFFFFLITALIYFHNSSAGMDVTLGAGGLYTIPLAASGITMWRAGAHAERSRAGAVRGWLSATILLGAVFLGGQGAESLRAFPSQTLASALFILVGCHQLHVLAGILLLGMALYLASPSAWDERRSVVVQTVALYWYFVTAVWIAIVVIGWIL